MTNRYKEATAEATMNAKATGSDDDDDDDDETMAAAATLKW
jgi:TATA-binding protein-associated factor Taf7